MSALLHRAYRDTPMKTLVYKAYRAPLERLDKEGIQDEAHVTLDTQGIQHMDKKRSVEHDKSHATQGKQKVAT